tara:strand:+ start:68 stop:1759 length:1692 start_codon:yes stop_codon:yes gene_type:complete
MITHSTVLEDFISAIGRKFVITEKWHKEPFVNGWRYGSGDALAVLKPANFIELWRVLKICISQDFIVIMQAANTGLTGGSTPNGNDYDRPIVIINTLRINDIQLINNAKQIIAHAGSTLYDLENKLKPFNREPHSVIGSTSIGASIVGGVCNNSGGSLVKRGPAYTELALYARLNKQGKLELINELGINLGKDPETILNNLQNGNFNKEDIIHNEKLASDDKYSKIVRGIDENTPARYNSDKRLLYGASGSSGKVVVFALRLDTYPKAQKNKVFYLGTNNPDVFWKIRRDMLSKFDNLPTLGDYLHRDCYDAAKKYSKDNFIVIEKLGTKFLPTLFELKRRVDIIANKVKFLPDKFSDRLMQFLSSLFPNHLPKRMEQFRNRFEYHWIVEMSDEGIDEAREYYDKFFKENEGDFFECNKKEGRKASLHRFVSASAVGRYYNLKSSEVGEMISLDVAIPRNEKQWFEKLPKDINEKIHANFHYGHLFCHVQHQNYILKKGVNAKKLKEQMLEMYNKRGAQYPAEHNFGHEYKAKPNLLNFYRSLDPTNTFNPGIGMSSKLKNWK